MKEKNVTKLLFPNAWKFVQDDEETIHSSIVDEDLDEFACHFDNADCIVIDTKAMTHITLSTAILEKMIKMIKKAECIYAQQNKID